jgi:hypothetical protein
LRQIIGGTRHLLLDFDGPICSVYAGTPAPGVAKQLGNALTVAGFTLPADIEDEDDPLEVFRAAAASGVRRGRRVPTTDPLFAS